MACLYDVNLWRLLLPARIGPALPTLWPWPGRYRLPNCNMLCPSIAPRTRVGQGGHCLAGQAIRSNILSHPPFVQQCADGLPEYTLLCHSFTVSQHTCRLQCTHCLTPPPLLHTHVLSTPCRALRAARVHHALLCLSISTGFRQLTQPCGAGIRHPCGAENLFQPTCIPSHCPAGRYGLPEYTMLCLFLVSSTFHTPPMPCFVTRPFPVKVL